MRQIIRLLGLTLAVAGCGGDSPSEPRVSSPVISTIAPTYGAVGTEVKIRGTRFARDTVRVFLGMNQTALPVISGDSLLTAIVPSTMVAGMYDVRVVNRDGGSATLPGAFEVVVPPVVDSISPSRGTVGTEVRIYGRSFGTSNVTVSFNGLVSPKVVSENGSLFVTVPEGITLGSVYDIRVNNRDREADTLFAGFRAVVPNVLRVNGVTKPTGLVGMLAFIEGEAFGDAKHGKVSFRATDGSRIQAVIADTTNDWADSYVVTTVPTGTADNSMIYVETATGVDSIEFSLIQNGTFSPATINWTQATNLPQPLQGLGAIFVPVEEGATPANYVFAVGGADSLNKATRSVYRAQVAQTGALGAWNTTVTQLPEPRAYHMTVGATAYTAALDTTTAAYLYVLGGKDSAGTTVSSVRYARVALDGQVESWQTGTPLPTPLHSASAVVFRGFIYLAGGADALNAAQAPVYRAAVLADGRLGAWETIASMPAARSHFSLVNFGPYFYAIGGERGTTAPSATTVTSTETANVDLARINLRNGSFTSAGWQGVNAMSKARSKHGSVFAGGALFVTSGIYSGIGVSGSSENTFAALNSDGTLGSWGGATGAETINSEIGYSLYNQAVVTFIDNTGKGHVLVLGGANTSGGKASAKVVYY